MIDNYLQLSVSSVRNLDMGSGNLGFRFDSQSGTRDQWTLEGDVMRVDEQDPLLDPSGASFAPARGHTDFRGGSILGRWTHTSSPGAETALQVSYYRGNLSYPYVGGEIGNLTIDLQRRWRTGERNELYAGVGYQRYTDDMSAGRPMRFSPATSDYDDAYAVLRDEFQLVPGRLTASVGLRLDRSDYAGLQYQPSLRLLYTPNTRHSAWIGASRAVRTPSRENRDIDILDTPIPFNGLPTQPYVYGAKSLKAETERSLEAGYRIQSGQRWSIDVSAFGSSYGRLIALHTPAVPQVDLSASVPMLVLPLTYDNAGAGRSYGGEVWASWRLSSSWKLVPSYSYLHEDRRLPASPDMLYYWDAPFHTVPHQFRLRSEYDFSPTWHIDVMARASSRDRQWQLAGGWFFDAWVAWHPTRTGELSLSVRDLSGRRVLESYPELGTPSIPTRRTVLVQWSQRF